MISIIIPAHNEERNICETIKSISITDIIDYEIIVICNGCTDNTHNIVKNECPDVIIIDSPIASKTNAMNLGDSISSGYPRFYLDADIKLSKNAITLINCEMNKSGSLIASTEGRMDLSESSLLVSMYFKAWRSLPYCKQGLIGTGIYALSKEGRARFDEFPSIIADDGYVRALFSPAERLSVSGTYSIVQAPKFLKDLIRIKTRSRLGRYELHEKFPEMIENDKNDYFDAALISFLNIRRWPHLLVYFLVNTFIRFRAKIIFKKHGYGIWERDESTR